MLQRTNNRLFRALQAAGGEALSARCERVRMTSAQVLYEAEDPVDYVYFPESGVISVVTVMLSGAMVETSVIGVEGGLGFIEAIGRGVMFSRCFSQVEGELLRVPAREYRRAYDASPEMRAIVADHVELLITEARQAIACQAKHAAGERLAWWLLEIQDRMPGVSDLPLTQDFLAAMMGVQRTTVTEFAGQLADKGAIRTRRGHVHVLDRAILEREACECYATTQRFRQMIEGGETGEEIRTASGA